MKKEPLTDEEFVRRYQNHETESRENFIRRYSRTREELEATIDFLIRHREMLKKVELQRLEAEAQKLLDRLKDIDREKLVEELKCFKEILSLQKRLLENNDNPPT